MNKTKIKQLLQEALKQHHVGNLDSADKIYVEILTIDNNDFDANHLHATVLSQKERYSESIKFFATAYESANPTCELLNNYAIALRNLRAYSECEKLLIEAIKLDKNFGGSYRNLSNCYLSQKKFDDAINILNTSIKLNLNTLDCHSSIVNILFSKLSNNSDKNILRDLKNHLKILHASNDKTLISQCALIYYNIGELEKSIELFKLAEKMYSDSVPSIDTLKNLSNKDVLKTFVIHEYEQIKHIDSDEDGIRNMKITQDFYDYLENLSKKSATSYNDLDYAFISELHKVKYNKPPSAQKNYLNKSLDFKNIEHIYSSSKPEIVVVDNFLDDIFLEQLRIFYRCSNIFKYPYTRGYIGAFLGKGMANKSFLEFSNELIKSFKSIFKQYHLSQAWAFKYDSRREGIGIHADDAKVNVNFWITPSSANKNPDNGGMIVWKKMPDKKATFKDFNSLKSMDKMNEDIKDADYVKVPYKANRAVIFNSKLYHVTDKIEFGDNYKDRRVNVTLLYK